MATAPITATAGPAPRVLVVDDEPGVVSFLGRALTAKGYLVDAAGGGEHALELLGAAEYDVVLLDLRMPGVNGVTVLRRLIAARPAQRVIVVSAAADTRVKVACLELGAVDFVAKPFELAELVARVGAHTRRPAPVAGPTVSGGLVFDADRRTVDAGGGPVALTSREFRLLRHLADRADELPCSREELLDAVWDTPFDTGTNVVDANVHRLRAKLGAGVIETVRNVGYRLGG